MRVIPDVAEARVLAALSPRQSAAQARSKPRQPSPFFFQQVDEHMGNGMESETDNDPVSGPEVEHCGIRLMRVRNLIEELQHQRVDQDALVTVGGRMVARVALRVDPQARDVQIAGFLEDGRLGRGAYTSTRRTVELFAPGVRDVIMAHPSAMIFVHECILPTMHDVYSDQVDYWRREARLRQGSYCEACGRGASEHGGE